MNTQRDLKIARWMKLDIRPYSNMLLSYDDRLGNVEWNPAENPEQLQMIEDFVVEQGYDIDMRRRKNYNRFSIFNHDTSMQLAQGSNKSKPLAFLQAVEQLVDSLKNK